MLGSGNTRQISPGLCPQGAHSLGLRGRGRLGKRTQWGKSPSRISTGVEAAEDRASDSRGDTEMGGGAWWAAVHGVAKSQTRLSDFTFTFHFHALEKEMATHSSVLAWRIPGTGEPGGLSSMGSHRVGHN